jgi:AcrR family transcriptional regulator
MDAREAILRAARELFARHGFKRTSVEGVARVARISVRSVYLHFSRRRSCSPRS